MIALPSDLRLRRYHLTACVALAVALLAGVLTPLYVATMGHGGAKLMALPAALILSLLLLYDRKVLLVLVMLFRSTGDLLLESTRFSLGSYQIGVGGLINAFIIFIAVLLAMEKPAALSRRNIGAWALFLLLALCGVASAPDKPEALRSWLSLFSYFAIFTTAFQMTRTAGDFRKCARIVLWSSVLPAVYGLFDFFMHGGLVGTIDFRLKSTFGHANAFAFYLTLVIGLGFYLLKSGGTASRPRSRFFLGFYLLLLVALLVLTKTRSAWLACIGGFVLYALLFERRYLLYLAMLAVTALFLPGVTERLTDLSEGNEVVRYARLNSFAWRVYLWQSAFQWVQPVHYAFGHGLQSFKIWSPVFFPLAGGIHWGAHSVYVQWLFELGIVGFAAYIAIFVRIVRQLIAMLIADRIGGFVMLSVVANYLVFAFSDNMNEILSFNWYFWFIVGAACSFAEHQRPGHGTAGG